MGVRYCEIKKAVLPVSFSIMCFDTLCPGWYTQPVIQKHVVFYLLSVSKCIYIISNTKNIIGIDSNFCNRFQTSLTKIEEQTMKAIEFETIIDKDGHICLPETFQHAYGKFARLVIVLPEENAPRKKRRQPGSAKGLLQILSDDDSYLNDFREYMP